MVGTACLIGLGLFSAAEAGTPPTTTTGAGTQQQASSTTSTATTTAPTSTVTLPDVSTTAAASSSTAPVGAPTSMTPGPEPSATTDPGQSTSSTDGSGGIAPQPVEPSADRVIGPAAVGDASVTITKRVALVETVAPNRYRVYYAIDVRSTSPTPVVFQADDVFQLSPTATIDSVSASVSAGPGVITPGFDGRTNINLASGTVSRSSGVLISLQAIITVTPPTTTAQADCALDAGESGTGLRNVATVGTGPGQSAVGCRPIPGAALVQIDKNAVGGRDDTFTFTVAGSDGSTANPTVSTSGGRGLTAGVTLTPGVTYTITENPIDGWTYSPDAGFCQIYIGTTLQTGRTVRSVNGVLTFTPAAGEQYQCFVANFADGQFVIDKVTDPPGDPTTFVVEIATRNPDGSYETISTVPISDARNGVSPSLTSRVRYYLRELPAGWATQTFRCGSATATGGNRVSVYLADGATVNCTVTNVDPPPTSSTTSTTTTTTTLPTSTTTTTAPTSPSSGTTTTTAPVPTSTSSGTTTTSLGLSPTTGVATTTTTGRGTGSGSASTSAPGPGRGTLPATGTSPWPVVAVAAACLGLGALVLAIVRRGRA